MFCHIFESLSGDLSERVPVDFFLVHVNEFHEISSLCVVTLNISTPCPFRKALSFLLMKLALGMQLCIAVAVFSWFSSARAALFHHQCTGMISFFLFFFSLNSCVSWTLKRDNWYRISCLQM